MVLLSHFLGRTLAAAAGLGKLLAIMDFGECLHWTNGIGRRLGPDRVRAQQIIAAFESSKAAN
jgi:hypothetical protein